MSHKTRVERHIVVDLIAAVAAGSLVAAITLKSVVAVLLGLAAGVALLLLERNNIQEEDDLEDSFEDMAVDELQYENLVPPPPSLTTKDIAILQKKASHPPAEVISEANLAPYIVGLEDGAAEMAKWVLNQLDSE